MHKDNKFRFHLQWEADTQERIQVGRFLEQLGNRKSIVVVEAVLQYMRDHPELQLPSSKVVIQIHSTRTEAQILEKVQGMIDASVDRRIANISIPAPDVSDARATDSPTVSDMDEMLENLELFF